MKANNCIMIPLGSLLVGAIPGALVGTLRKFQDREQAPLPPLLAGFLTVVIMRCISGVLLVIDS